MKYRPDAVSLTYVVDIITIGRDTILKEFSIIKIYVSILIIILKYRPEISIFYIIIILLPIFYIILIKDLFNRRLISYNLIIGC